MITEILTILFIVYVFLFIPATIIGMIFVIREQRKLFRQLRHTMTIFFPAAKSWEVDAPANEGKSKVEVKPLWDEEREPIA